MTRIDIDSAWEEFRVLAAPILAEEDDRPEDVREACRRGDAWLFAAEDGFLVLQCQLRPATRSMQLLIWIAVSRGPHGFVERHSAWLRELARGLGVSRILFRTRRRGFERVLPEAWRLEHVTYAMEVEDVQG